MEKDKGLTFLYLNVLNDLYTGAEYELYSAYCQSYLKSNGVKVKQYINIDTLSIDNLVKDIVNQSFERLVVFFSEYNYYISKVVINSIKQIDSSIEIIGMGAVSEYVSNHFKEDVLVDYFCEEDEFPQLLYISRSPLFSEYNRDDFSSISYAQVQHPYSNGILPAEEVFNIGIISSRGCVGKCQFCSYGVTINVFPIGSIIDELIYLQKQLVNQNRMIYFYDDCFSISQSRTIQLCNEIEKANLSFEFFCWTRIDLLSEKVIDALERAKFKSILVGLESASENVLKSIGKLRGSMEPKVFLEMVVERIKYAKTKNITILVSINFGQPGETIHDALKTVEFLQSNNIHYVSYNYMTIFPMSRMLMENKCDAGRYEESPTKLPFRTFYPDLNVKLISDKVKQIGWVDSYVYNKFIHHNKVVNYYCKVTEHRTHWRDLFLEFVEEDDVISKKEILTSNSYVIRKCQSLSLSQIYCDNRNILKYQIEEQDEFQKKLYDLNVYLVNFIFQKKKDDKCMVFVNNLVGNKKYIFHYFGSDIIKKIEFVCKHFEDFWEKEVYTYSEIEQIIFDDMNLFTIDRFGKYAIYEDNSQQLVGISENNKIMLKSFIDSNPLVYVFINTVLFVYRNYHLFLSAQAIKFATFHHDFYGKSYFSNEHVVIQTKSVMVIFNTFRKKFLLLNEKEAEIMKSFILAEGDDKVETRHLCMVINKLKNKNII